LAVLVGRILDPVDVLVDRKNRLGEISAEGLVAGPNVEVKLHAFFGGVVAEGGGVSAGLTAEFFSVHGPGDVIRGPLEGVGVEAGAPAAFRAARVRVVRL